MNGRHPHEGSADEQLDDFVNEAFEEGFTREEIISALELKLMALREEAEGDD